MFSSLNKLVNNQKCYEYLIKFAPTLIQNVESLHNKNRLKLYPPSMRTFEGYCSCGAISFLLYHYIRKEYQDVPIKFLLSSYGYGKYLEDHLYLQVDKYLVDPTYRQFVVSYDETGKYLDFVFDECPFIFVGKDIKYLFKDCQDKHLEITSRNLRNDNLIFWENSKDVTETYLNKDIKKIGFESENKDELLKFINIL